MRTDFINDQAWQAPSEEIGDEDETGEDYVTFVARVTRRYA
jgi:hypothetical protein